MPQSQEGFQWTPTSKVYGLETESVVPSTATSQLKSTYDVIVIGAGFAGLIAARDVSRKIGTKVLLIEARDRIGGRTWTASALGEHFEMGGTWIHWNQPHVFAELYRYGLHTVIKTSNGTLDLKKIFYKPIEDEIRPLSRDKMYDTAERIAQAFFSIDGYTSRELMPYPHEPFRQPAPWTKYDHLSVKDRLDQIGGSQADKDYFESLTNSIGSAPGSEIAFVEPLRWFAMGGHSMSGLFETIQTYKLGLGGQTLLARNILGDYHGHIQTNTNIKSIVGNYKGVELTTKQGQTLGAKYVICTIPLNCLGDITFSPPLSPLRSQTIQRGHMNQGAKIHFKLRQPEPAFFVFANGYGASPWCLAFSDHSGTDENIENSTYCVGFGYNKYLPDREASEEIVSSFKEHMKPDAEVNAYLTHDWVRDPLSKGTWSCWRPGEMVKYLKELQKDHGRVLMANSDWADGWRGFINGAIERGSIAARDVHRRLSQDTKDVLGKI